MKSDQPASIPVLISAVLSTGVALAAVFIPNLLPATQALIIAFGNSIIALGAAVWLNARNTSSSAPILPEGTPVKVEGTGNVEVIGSTESGSSAQAMEAATHVDTQIRR